MGLHYSMYERITELVSLLNDFDLEPTIRKISTITETSLSRTREDLYQLRKAGLPVCPEEVISSLDKDDSRYDDEVLWIDLDLSPDSRLLFLNDTERNLFVSSRFRKMLIKDSPLSVSDEVRQRAAMIDTAIRQSVYVRFRYRFPQDKRIEMIETAPRMLFHNTTDDLYYCITFAEDGMMLTYRLDRMIHEVHPVRDRHFERTQDVRLERLNYMWGAAFDNNAEPVRTVLEIYPNTPNLLTKIKNDTRGRKYGKLTKTGDTYIYEDEIIGLGAFRAWVMSFGSSVKVLEPASLAEEILNSSKTRLLNYEDGGRFH